MVAVVPRDNVKVTEKADKLHVVDASATIQRHACPGVCGVCVVGDRVRRQTGRDDREPVGSRSLVLSPLTACPPALMDAVATHVAKAEAA